MGEVAHLHATKELRGPSLRLETPFDGYNTGVEVTDLLEHSGGHVYVSFTGMHEPSVNIEPRDESRHTQIAGTAA